ncbi:MAG: helix-turn-helix domain-containing protein [Chitinophagaceae bacterium]
MLNLHIHLIFLQSDFWGALHVIFDKTFTVMLLVGHKIKKLRELKGLKQDDVAERLNISQAAYSRLEKDEVKVDVNTLERIAEVFQMRVEEIIYFDEKSSFFINNHNSHVANGGVNYGTINDAALLNKSFLELNERFERQRKEIEDLKVELSNLKRIWEKENTILFIFYFMQPKTRQVGILPLGLDIV